MASSGSGGRGGGGSSAVESWHSCIVIGAGCAGLYAAQQLRAAFPDVLVVEAQEHVGGRIRQLHGFTGWPIEVGPEFVHGNRSKFTQVVAGHGFQFEEKRWPDFWYNGTTKRLMDDDAVDKEVDELHDLMDSVGDEAPPPPGTDVTAEAWLAAKGATPLQLEVADVCYANDFGCSLRQLGLREMIVENQRWDSGDTYLIMDQPMSAVVERLAAGLTIRTGCPISAIHYDAAGAVLTGPGGLRLHARKVVITAPLAVLQAGRIAFHPPLPAHKVAAIGRLRMGNAAKIIIAFNTRFWPEQMYDVVCTHSFVPEFWMTRHAVSDADNQHLHAVVGFVAGERTAALAGMPAAEAVAKFLAQLDEVFGCPAQPRPASSAYVKAHVFDWSREPWVGGAYSYPSYGAADGDREALAAPVAGTLFFAGEATHPAVNPCMQAALETGERAAAQVKTALLPLPSRL